MSVSKNTVLKQKHTAVRFIKQQNHMCSTMVLKSYFITPPLSIKVIAETLCLHESPNPVQESYLVVFHTHPQKKQTRYSTKITCVYIWQFVGFYSLFLHITKGTLRISRDALILAILTVLPTSAKQHPHAHLIYRSK